MNTSTATSVGPEAATLVTAIGEALRNVIVERQVTDGEWYAILDFLTAVGQADEFILLSDVLGLSVLVDAQTHAGAGGTASTVLGPFWRPAPPIDNPGTLSADDEPGEPFVLSGVVGTAGGQPIEGATVDVWQCDAEGRYDVQLGGAQPRLRGVLTTDEAGRYEVRTVVPPPYEVKNDGPVGRLLTALGRHAFRPAHVHLRVAAAGHRPLVTQVFFAGDPWLGNDTIGADRPELVVDVRHDDGIAHATFDVEIVREEER
jgi:hydroxyquinol 1,2-dioxygenase